MRILFAFTGRAEPAYPQGGLADALARLPTTHTSEVSQLLLADSLRRIGHAVTFADAGVLARLDAREYDALFLYKTHGLRLAASYGLLRQPFRLRTAWMDAPGSHRVLGGDARRLQRIGWATRQLLAQEAPGHDALQVVCAHATNFVSPPAVGSTQPVGLFAGRLPEPYLADVLTAAGVVPMRVYALWIQWDGQKILLRPQQIDAAQLAFVRRALPAAIDLRTGANMHVEAEVASSAAFGLCPAATPGVPQPLSASKFYDYLALGLPVLVADNIPEADLVRAYPWLGMIYDPRVPATLTGAIAQILQESSAPDFMARRQRIQEWVFADHTSGHRAAVLHETLFA